MFSKNRIITIGLTLVAVAVAYRVEPARNVLTGEQKLFGIF